jgi:serine/threonine protein kinase
VDGGVLASYAAKVGAMYGYVAEQCGAERARQASCSKRQRDDDDDDDDDDDGAAPAAAPPLPPTTAALLAARPDALALLAVLPTRRPIFGGRFERGAKIGEGSFGDVYAAWDSAEQTYVIVKRIKAPEQSSGGIHNTIMRELVVMQALRHPNVLPLLDAMWLPDGQCVFVFPAITHDLNGLLRWQARGHHGGPRPFLATDDELGRRGHLYEQRMALVKGIFGQLCDGLRYLHRSNVIHRDVKMSNVLLHADGTVVLCDFGWARFWFDKGDARSRRTFPPCSLNYRPLEVFMDCSKDGRAYGTSIDVYGAGCILFELLTGRLPFAGAGEAEIVADIVRVMGPPPAEAVAGYSAAAAGFGLVRDAAVRGGGKAPTPFASQMAQHQVPAAAERLLRRMLGYDVAARPTIDEVLRDAWLVEHPRPATAAAIAAALPEKTKYRWYMKNH